MANTSPRALIHERTDEELLEDLCRELRYVAVDESDLPNGERVVAHIREVCAVHTELSERRVDFQSRLESLSEETRWQMPALLADCLAYPQRLPYVQEPDGIRRYLRCQLCSMAERPHDAKLFWFCEGCMRRLITAVKQRTPINGIILFRTYNSENRCVHADSDTVLASDYYNDTIAGVCETCIHDEIERRHVTH